MKIRNLHSWNMTPREAVQLQRQLAGRVNLDQPRRKHWDIIAGADMAVSKSLGKVVAGAVVMRLPELEVIEEVVAVADLTFPYVPGLLSFREAPSLLEVFRRMEHVPHAVICDGQGIAHPRGLGLASHLGLWLGVPTVGSAKSRFVGEHRREPGNRRGCKVRLDLDGRRVGYVLRTRDGVKPLYVSPGHLIDLDTATRLVLRCTRGYRLPEPQRRSDQLVGRRRRELELEKSGRVE